MTTSVRVAEYSETLASRNSFERLRDLINLKTRKDTSSPFVWPDDFISGLSAIDASSPATNFEYAVAGAWSECRLLDTSALTYQGVNDASNPTYLNYSSTLRSAKITGSFTSIPWLSGCTALSYLSIAAASANYSIPAQMFSNLPNLQYCNLSIYLNGPMSSAFFSNCTKLKAFKLYQLSGDLIISSAAFKSKPILEEVYLGMSDEAAGVLYIKDEAFAQSGRTITQLSMDNCVEIGASAFYSALSISGSKPCNMFTACSKIGDNAFNGCYFSYPEMNFSSLTVNNPGVSGNGWSTFIYASFNSGCKLSFYSLSAIPDCFFQQVTGWPDIYCMSAKQIGSVGMYGGCFNSVYFPEVVSVYRSGLRNAKFKESVSFPKLSYIEAGQMCFGYTSFPKGLYLSVLTSITSSTFIGTYIGKSFSVPALTTIQNSAFANATFEMETLRFTKLTSTAGSPFANAQFKCKDVYFPQLTNASMYALMYGSTFASYQTVFHLSRLTSASTLAFHDLRYVPTFEIPELTYIGLRCFERCWNWCKTIVSDVTYGYGYFPKVATVMQSGFTECFHLTSIDLPQATSIQAQAFRSCSALASLNAPKLSLAVTSLFDCCSNLQTVTLGCTSAQAGIFTSSNPPRNLVELNFPNLTTAVTNMLYTVSDSAAAIKGRTLSFGALTTVPTLIASRVTFAEAFLPKCTTLQSRAFYGAYISSYSLPNVTTIGAQAFEWTRVITGMDLPKVTNIGKAAFSQAWLMSWIKIGTSNCTLASSDAFFGCNTLESIMVPKAYVNKYKSAANWSFFSSKIVGY